MRPPITIGWDDIGAGPLFESCTVDDLWGTEHMPDE